MGAHAKPQVSSTRTHTRTHTHTYSPLIQPLGASGDGKEAGRSCRGIGGAPLAPRLLILTIGLVVQAVVHLHARPGEGDLGREVDRDAGSGYHGDPLGVGLQGTQATQPGGDRDRLRAARASPREGTA